MHLIKREMNLALNSIFKFHNKLYTTNHPGEETSPNSALIDREKTDEARKKLYINKDTGDFIVEDTYNEGTYSFFKDKIIPKKEK